MRILNFYRSAEDINNAMGRVYGLMALAVGISMCIAMAIPVELLAFLHTGIMHWITVLSPLVVLLIIAKVGIETLSKNAALACLFGFAALMGLSFSTIFVVYTQGSIVSAFMGGAVLFSTLSIWGYFTKRDLTAVGNFMFVGLIAIILASIINIFIGSTLMTMVISAIAIVVFLGLTAYDTQKIRETVSLENGLGNAEVIGALTLYLDFINLFLSLLQLFGDRR